MGAGQQPTLLYWDHWDRGRGRRRPANGQLGLLKMSDKEVLLIERLIAPESGGSFSSTTPSSPLRKIEIMTLSYNIPSTTSYQEESYRFDAGALGHIEGLTVTSNGKPALRYFGGLPYALPPLGPFRFRAPRTIPPCYRYGTKANPGRFTGGTSICPQVSFSRYADSTSRW